jgi:hypothetical protein
MTVIRHYRWMGFILDFTVDLEEPIQVLQHFNWMSQNSPE